MAEGAKGTASDVYVLGTGEAAADRLRLLDEVYGPSTRKLLLDAGLGPGTRALDLACGIGAVSCWMAAQVGPMGSVVAADVNPDQLVVSKWHCAKCDHLPIDYIEASAYATGFPDESFDLAHMRFLLCHLTEPQKFFAKRIGSFVPAASSSARIFGYRASSVPSSLPQSHALLRLVRRWETHWA